LKEQAGDANFRVVDIPKGREPGEAFAVNALGAALADLKLDDVHKEEQAQPPAGDKVLRAQFLTLEGLRVTISVWKQADQNYARLRAEVDPAAADAHIQAEQHQAQAATTPDGTKPETAKPPLDAAKDRQQRLDALQKEAEDFSRRFDGWTFVLPASTFATLDKSLDDLLKPLENKAGGGATVKKKPAKG
jgi:hypothetical protein